MMTPKNNTPLTVAEKLFCKYQIGCAGNFDKQLIRTIMAADDNNQRKLARAYPELVSVVDKFQHEVGYWETLEQRWNTQN